MLLGHLMGVQTQFSSEWDNGADCCFVADRAALSTVAVRVTACSVARRRREKIPYLSSNVYYPVKLFRFTVIIEAIILIVLLS